MPYPNRRTLTTVRRRRKARELEVGDVVITDGTNIEVAVEKEGGEGVILAKGGGVTGVEVEVGRGEGEGVPPVKGDGVISVEVQVERG